MAPIEAPEGELTHYIPPLTGQWVSQVARQQAGIDPVATRHWRPVTSDDHVVQLIGVRPGKAAGTSTVFLIAWDHPYSADASRYVVTARSGRAGVPARVTAARALDLPTDVRKEVMAGGFAAAPARVVWLEVEVGPVAVDPGARPSLALHLSHPAGDGVEAGSSTVDVVTSDDFDAK
jgi:hypothetical protein